MGTDYAKSMSLALAGCDYFHLTISITDRYMTGSMRNIGPQNYSFVFIIMLIINNVIYFIY